MDLALPRVADQFAAAADKAVSGAGGVDLARRAEADPAIRATQVKPILDALGVHDIDPTADVESAAVAGEMCRVAGRYVLPFPIVGYLLADPDHDMPAVLASSPPLRCDHGDLFPRWRVYDLAGGVSVSTPSGQPVGSRLAPFVTELKSPGAATGTSVAGVAYLSTLWAFYLLGVAEHSLELAIAHVKDRVQFGRPLAAMQAVQFELADATVAVDGLRELAHFTIWQGVSSEGVSREGVSREGVSSQGATTLADGLAARLHALDVLHPVLRLAQQLHGASGFCEEYDISVLVRHVQPAVRLPVDSEAMCEIVFNAIQTQGFTSLFSK